MLKNDTLKNGTSHIDLHESAPPAMATSFDNQKWYAILVKVQCVMTI